MIETTEDIVSGVSSLDIGRAQMSAQMIKVNTAVMM